MQPKIVILTGDVGSGKTTSCRQLAARARLQGTDCAGIVCPARFDGARKVGIDLLNLKTGECRRLADVDNQPCDVRTDRYRFHTEALAWGAATLEVACPCELLIVDEIGPLELIRGQGWVNALAVLRAGQFELAVVVVRPSLINTFVGAMANARAQLSRLPVNPGDDYLFALLSLLRSE